MLSLRHKETLVSVNQKKKIRHSGVYLSGRSYGKKGENF